MRRRARTAVTLTAVVLMLVAPDPWGVLALAALGAVRLGIPLARRLARGRRRLAVRRAERRGAAGWGTATAAGGAVALGRDARGREVELSGAQLGAHALIVGASGSGKTTTLETILADRIARGHPVVTLDMKGSPAFARALALAAHDAGRGIRVWTPAGPSHWNPLAHGSPTALKDKLVSAERFSEPHYQRAAERYLQSALQVLTARRPGIAPRLSEVVAAMEPGRLRALARDAPQPLAGRVGAYLDSLTPDQRSAAAGLGTRLALLSESDAGRFLEPPPAGAVGREIDLAEGLAGGDVVLLSINSSVYGTLGAQLGALAVQDLTSAAGRRLGAGAGGRLPATVAVDEFSALGGDNVLALLARGREAGVGVLLATQELADLERAGHGFRDQVLGITALTLAHRQEVHESALAVSRIAGTEMVWRESRPVAPGGLARLAAQVGAGPHARTHATRVQREEPVVHPNVVKRLPTGRLLLLTHVPRPIVARVDVRAPGARGGGGREGPDQAAPGVTR